MFLLQHMEAHMLWLRLACNAGDGNPIFDLETGTGPLSFEDDGCFTCLPDGYCGFDEDTATLPIEATDPLILQTSLRVQRAGLYLLSYFLENGPGEGPSSTRNNSWATSITVIDPPFNMTFDVLLNTPPFNQRFCLFSFPVPQPDAVVKVHFQASQVRLLHFTSKG